MAYSTTPQRLDRDQQLRQHILGCALQRVVQGGFAALTMQALAEDAGIATGSLYRHFANKGELSAEVFALASQREIDALGAVLQGPGSPAERLRDGLRLFAARAWHSRRLAFALIAEPVEEAVDHQRLRYRQAYAGLFEQLLEQGRAAGQFHYPALRITAACLVGAIAEALVGPLAPHQEHPRADAQLALLSHSVSHFCLSALGADLSILESQS